MSEDDNLLRELDSIVERSKSSKFVDASVDYTANSNIRESLLVRLTLLHNRTVDKYSQAMQFGALDVVVIRSHKGILRPHNLVLDAEIGNARLRNAIFLNSESGWEIIDGTYDRSLYFNEYEMRYNMLYTTLEKGKLDDCLGYSPEVLMHSIMGLSGELLPRLGIDPRKGETYNSLKSAEKPLTRVSNQTFTRSIINILEDFNAKQAVPKSNTADVKQRMTVFGYLTDEELGLSVSNLTDEHREVMCLPKEITGVIVVDVVEGSPANKAGVKGCNNKLARGRFELSVGGDIILEADGKKTGTTQEFT